jgi:hypothetical protein
MMTMGENTCTDDTDFNGLSGHIWTVNKFVNTERERRKKKKKKMGETWNTKGGTMLEIAFLKKKKSKLVVTICRICKLFMIADLFFLFGMIAVNEMALFECFL